MEPGRPSWPRLSCPGHLRLGTPPPALSGFSPCLWMVPHSPVPSPPSVLVHMLIVSRTPSWMYPELGCVGVPLSLWELESIKRLDYTPSSRLTWDRSFSWRSMPLVSSSLEVRNDTKAPTTFCLVKTEHPIQGIPGNRSGLDLEFS